MNVKIDPSWKQALAAEWEAPYFAELTERVRQEYRERIIYPPASKIFAAFDATPFDSVKVVILGQDPYHGPGQAMGLSFSVPESIALPPSLINIYKEVYQGAPIPQSGNLTGWARQGVLLLNSVLTVRDGQAASHASIGWERFTDAAIEALNRGRDNIVFMLWGSHARRKGAYIDRTRHLVLESAHPSPLSAYRGFLGNRHFLRANEYLSAHNITPIAW